MPKESEVFPNIVRPTETVSVIITTFNRADLVVEAIESVRRQTWQNTQIIVIDDGSTDDTRKFLTLMEDVEYGLAREYGTSGSKKTPVCKEQQENFIATLDSDDLWDPEFLEQSIEAMRTLNVDLIFSNWVGMNDRNQLIKSLFEKDFEWWHFRRSEIEHCRIIELAQLRKLTMDACIAPPSAWVYRKKVIDSGWSYFSTITEDWALLMHLVICKPSLVAVNMRRSWLKRVQSDNVFDQAKPYRQAGPDRFTHHNTCSKTYFAPADSK